MTQSDHWAGLLHSWLTDHALPLWSTAGIDPATGTSWEALDHHGTPLRDMPRRQRVQFRQANVFARTPQTRDLGWQVFRHVMDHGFDPDTGLFATWVGPDLRHLDQNHDLYDLAFGLLAAASLGQAGFDVAADIARLERALDILRADVGWHETPTHRQPRRQNPHMHLFEATTALYALTHAPAHLAMAQTCLDLVTTRALTPDMTLLEFFDAGWTPLSGARQANEPGHLAEWIYLADAFATVTGTPTGLPLRDMWNKVVEHRLPSGFVPDQAGIVLRRLWPQTELLKAAVVMARAGYNSPADAPDTQPAAIAKLIWDSYMDTPVAGGWYDQFNDTTGTLVSGKTMPASTLYHIDLAIDACLPA